MTERRAERIDLRYELLELRNGRLHRFASLAALVRFISARRHGVLPARTSIPARPPPPRRKKRK